MSVSDPQDDQLLGELAALADGSLRGPRRAELEARVAEDPQLAAALAEQQRAVALIREAAAAVHAPELLGERAAQPQPARPPWAAGVLVLLAIAAVLALALVLL